MEIQRLAYHMNKIIITLLLTVIGTNCAAQYTIDTLLINNNINYYDSIYFNIKKGKIEGMIEYNEGKLFFTLKNSRTIFKDIAFFKVISECVAIVSDKNYMKPKNEIEFYSIKGDSTIYISAIDNINNIIEIKSNDYDILLIETYVTEFGEKNTSYDIVIVEIKTCVIHHNGFTKEFLVPKNDSTETLRSCSIDVYVNNEMLYLDYNCLKHEELGKIKKTFIFSEIEGKFIPTTNEKK